jgi:hypothetical protein
MHRHSPLHGDREHALVSVHMLELRHDMFELAVLSVSPMRICSDKTSTPVGGTRVSQ